MRHISSSVAFSQISSVLGSCDSTVDADCGCLAGTDLIRAVSRAAEECHRAKSQRQWLCWELFHSDTIIFLENLLSELLTDLFRTYITGSSKSKAAMRTSLAQRSETLLSKWAPAIS